MDAKDKITQLLRERGWSIYELAKRSGLSSTTIANMYKRNTQPTIPSLEAMCRAFGITMSQFFLEGGEAGALPEEQRELLHRWATLSKEQKGLVLALMRNMR